jgi:hypothetical protein
MTPIRIFSLGEVALPPGKRLKEADAAREVLRKVRRVRAFIVCEVAGWRGATA